MYLHAYHPSINLATNKLLVNFPLKLASYSCRNDDIFIHFFSLVDPADFIRNHVLVQMKNMMDVQMKK